MTSLSRAPTRPHPVVSRRPPGNVVAALPLTPIDRSRDALDALALRAPGGAAAVPRAAGRALARVAGWVERAGPLRRRRSEGRARVDAKPGDEAALRARTRFSIR